MKTGIKALVTMLVAVTAVRAVYGVAMADGPGAGGGPAGPAREPITGTLPDNQPLIELRISNGMVTGVTGTAVAPEDRGAPYQSSHRATTTQAGAIWFVNFSHSKHLIGGHASATGFGGFDGSLESLLSQPARGGGWSTTRSADAYMMRAGVSVLEERRPGCKVVLRNESDAPQRDRRGAASRIRLGNRSPRTPISRRAIGLHLRRDTSS